MFETASSKVSDRLFSMTHLPKAQILWKYELMLKWMRLLSHSSTPTVLLLVCPHTHRNARHACTCTYARCARTLAPPTQTHTCRLCVQANAVHACLLELSYVEKIFDLSQATNQILHYLHSVSWVCWLLGPSPASDAGYRGSQREIPTHSCLWGCVCECVFKVAFVWFCACTSLCCCRLRI